jgi:succinyl-diaminopimelate desuccinylase
MPAVDTYLEEHFQQFEDQLCELLAIPSVSADSQYAPAVRQGCQWLVNQFKSLGLETETIETSGHPLVFAQSEKIPNRPTVLVYGHYDVQPPDPLDQWITPPFEPTRRDGNVYARGATDDKGQLLTHIKSAQAWIETAGALPLQIKYLIEGEEEVGSAGLERFLAEQADRLACDVVIVSDTCQYGRGLPAITYGLRGIVYFQLHLQGPKQDLHSGSFGGAVTNPANALCRIMSSLMDENGRVRIPNFYDDVRDLTAREQENLASLPFDEQAFMNQVGVEGLSGEVNYSTLQRRWTRPTFDIHGLGGGYQGEGAKTIIPSTATAKFSFRLVPDQDPAKITASLKQWLASNCPPGIQMRLTESHGSPGVVVPLESPYMSAAARAIEHGFGRAPVFIREGGSIPIVSAFRYRLNADTLLLGWGLDDDNAHGPNEKFSLTSFRHGIKASACLWKELGQLQKLSKSN